MTNSVIYLFAIIAVLTMMSCNSEPKNTPSTTVTSQQTDNNQMPDTNQPAKITTTDTPVHTDAVTIDAPAFQKTLSFKDISFNIKARGKGSLQQVTIQPLGLSKETKALSLETEPVVDAVVDDLNSDGNPELLIFTQSAGSGSYGNVVAYSVNNGKSISQVTFPATSKNTQLKNGYMGHDRFTVVNHQLTQTFPIYKESDTNSEPTRNDRVVTYRLKAGEASWVFLVDKVKEVQHQ